MIHGAKGKQAKSSVILYLSRPLRSFIRRSLFAVLVMLSLLTIFVSRTDSPFTRSVRMFVDDSTSSVMFFLSVPFRYISGVNQSLVSYLFVHEKNEELSKENKLLRDRLINLSQVAVENGRLKKLLFFVEDIEYSFVSAKVVGTVSGPFVRSVLINAGKRERLTKGQAVVSEYGIVGRIIEVGSRSSRILLITDINSRIPVVSSLSIERGIMAGNNSENPQLVYLPKDNTLQNGEVMVTSGDGDLLPSGLPVGTVEIVSEGEYVVHPFVRWHRLEHLSVLNYIPEEDKVLSLSRQQHR